MTKKIKKLMAGLLTLILLLSLIPVESVKAAGGNVIPGTNITVRLEYGNLIVEGEGEIPDYSPETLKNRPWDGMDIKSVTIGPGITRIGAYAFANFWDLQTINMYSTTFIGSYYSFYNIYKYPTIRINGSLGRDVNFNGLIYNSMESIAANAPNKNECIFLVDTDTVANSFRTMWYPYHKYVYPVTDEEKPWQSRKSYIKSDGFSNVCSVSKDNNMSIFVYMSATKEPLSEDMAKIVSYFKGNNTYLSSYFMNLIDKDKIVYGTEGAKKYILKLSGIDQVPGRVYSLIHVGPDGRVDILNDLDSDISTVTFETAYPTTFYALIYHY